MSDHAPTTGSLASVAEVTSVASRRHITLVKQLGGGTQGDVYLAALGNADFAVKWYLPSYLRLDPRLRGRLSTLIASGPPGPHFVWPLDLVEVPGRHGFGYLMPFIQPRFVTFNMMLLNKIDPSFRVLATAGLGLAQAFLDLHAGGFCYFDINFGNVRFDPDTGEICICDNDNVDVDGKASAMTGSPRFMAPEIVRGERAPTIATDLHSLAVLLFWMLMLHHPLVGRREMAIRFPEAADDVRLFGTEPLFIFDPHDDSNAPDAEVQSVPLIFWRLYPRFLRTLFTQAFTRGLFDPSNGRVMESAWRPAMVRLRDSIFTCIGCGSENFFNPDLASETEPATCWQCGVTHGPRLLLKIGETDVVVSPGAELFPHHLMPGQPFDFTLPLARVVAHPVREGHFGLLNAMGTTWTAQMPNGKSAPVPDGRSALLTPGITIDFGPSRATVIAQ